MTKHRISDDEVEALLRGDASSVSPELSALAQSLSEFRVAAFEATPQPSAALLARLEADAPAPAGAVSRRKRVRKMLSWFTGLGVLAKIILGSTVAAAAVAGAGAAGALPGGAQDVFNTVVSVVAPATDDEPQSTPTDEPSDDPSHEPSDESSDDPSPEPTEGTDGTENEHPDNFGGTISEWAHNPNKGDDGPFGDDVSDAAHDKNEANEHPNGNDGDDESDDSPDSTNDHHGGNSEEHGGGKHKD